MKKPDKLYLVREPEAAAAPIVAHIESVEPTARRDCTWRDLVRRLQKNPAPRKPA